MVSRRSQARTCRARTLGAPGVRQALQAAQKSGEFAKSFWEILGVYGLLGDARSSEEVLTFAEELSVDA